VNGRDYVTDLGVHRWVILKCILKKLGVNWIHLVQERDQCRFLVNTVINFMVP
jgi:hypothetical protein